MSRNELPFVEGFARDGNVNRRCQAYFALYRACLKAARGNHPAAMLIYEKINLRMPLEGSEKFDNANIKTFGSEAQKERKNGSG